MPKEQIRKRGRRKPKTEAVPEPPVQDVTPTFTEAPQPAAEPVAGPSSGIHPSRAAMMKGGPRLQSRPEDATPQAECGEPGQPGEGEGQAMWGRPVVQDPAFPFGELDPDVKAYFRNVEDQIKDWEGTSSVGEEREGEPSPLRRDCLPGLTYGG